MTLLDDEEIAYNISILFNYLENNYPNAEKGLIPTLAKYKMARRVLKRRTKGSRYEFQIILVCIISLQKNLSKPHTRPKTFKDILL